MANLMEQADMRQCNDTNREKENLCGRPIYGET